MTFNICRNLMIFFFALIYLVVIYPMLKIDYYYRIREYENRKEVFVKNMLYLQELNRQQVKDELKAEIQNGNLFIENKTM